jgi:hypothetical protein
LASPRTIRTAVVVDLVLVVALIVALVAYLTNTGAPAAAPTATGTGTSVATPAGAGTPTAAGASSFALPSGNITCAMAADGVTCTIADFTYKPPKPAEKCKGTTGHVVTLDARSATFPCVDGPPPAVADAGVKVLEYGSTSKVGDFTCTSSTSGVTCTNGSGVGFRLARGSWQNLP